MFTNSPEVFRFSWLSVFKTKGKWSSIDNQFAYCTKITENHFVDIEINEQMFCSFIYPIILMGQNWLKYGQESVSLRFIEYET